MRTKDSNPMIPLFLMAACASTLINPIVVSADYKPASRAIARYKAITDITAEVSISSDGVATCHGVARTTSTDYSCILTMELQRKVKGSWEPVYTWEKEGSLSASLYKDYAVTSGYYYRVYVTVEVYDEDGTLLDDANLSSNIQFYA